MKRMMLVLIGLLIAGGGYTAELYWWGNDTGNEGEWNEADNWIVVSTGAASPSVPADGDTIYFDARAYYNETSGTYQSVDDPNTTGCPDLDGVYVSADYDGDIGYVNASGDVYVADISMTDGNFVYEGTGTAYIRCGAASADDTVDRTIVNTATGILYLSSYENDASNLSAWDEVYVYDGTVYIDKYNSVGCWVNDLYVIGGQVVADPSAYRTLASADQTDIYQDGGTIYWTDDFNNCYITGGAFYWGLASSEIATGVVGNYLEMRSDSSTATDAAFYWRVYDADGTSVLKQFKIYGSGCTLDASTSTHNDINKTLGSGSGEDSENWFGTAKLNPSTINFSLGANTTVTNYGGTLSTPNSEAVSF